MRSLGLACGAALLAAGCQTTARPAGPPGSVTARFIEGTAAPPAADGARAGTLVQVRSPDPTKWVAAAGRRGLVVYLCRPLVCADGTTGVMVAIGPSPTRDPDPEALRKLARIIPVQIKAERDIAAIASDGRVSMESLSSRVARLRDFPAIVAETRRSGSGKATYLATGHLFVGRIQVKIGSLAGDRATARRHLDDFVASLQIEDRPPGAAPAAGASAPEVGS